jgi:hypothetical protein
MYTLLLSEFQFISFTFCHQNIYFENVYEYDQASTVTAKNKIVFDENLCSNASFQLVTVCSVYKEYIFIKCKKTHPFASFPGIRLPELVNYLV